MITGKIGVVTVTFNSESYLDQFINSLSLQDYHNFKTYIIDNSSKDNTVSLLNSKYLNRVVTTVVANENNLGVAAGNNQGISMALNEGCEWILLLNNDTTFPSNFFTQLLASSEQNDWRVVVPKIHFENPSGHIWYGGGGFNGRRGYTGYHTGIGELDHGQFDFEATVDYSPTCAMLVHRSVFYQIGLMDESYFVYFDDTDFCWRMKLAGISIGYTASTSLVHKVGGSTGGGTSPFGAYMTARNRLYFLSKFWSPWHACAWVPIFILYYVFRYLITSRSWKCFTESIRGTFTYGRLRPCIPKLPTCKTYDKPLLVVVTSRFPWPLDHGFAIRVHWMLKLLKKRFRIHLHVVDSSPISDDAFLTAKALCEQVNIHKVTRISRLVSIFRHLFSGLPFQCALFHTPRIQRLLDADLCQAEAAISIAARTAPLLVNFSGPRFCDMADSVGQAYLNNAQTSSNILWRQIYKIEGTRMLVYERQLAAEFNGSFLFNPQEANNLARSGRVTVVPHGVDPRLLSLETSGSRFADGVVLFGKMNYRPNVECALWFIAEVMPLLPTDIKLYVVGSQPDDRLVVLAAKNSRVVVTGFIDDPYPDIRGSIAMICPIRMGGGSKNKVIESLAVGAVTLISQLASKAFDDIPSSGMLVCEEPRSWADAILNARKNRSSSLALAKAGRDYARERFSWEAFGRIIGDQIDEGIKMHLSQAEKQA